jgi:hypothetical protein
MISKTTSYFKPRNQFDRKSLSVPAPGSEQSHVLRFTSKIEADSED